MVPNNKYLNESDIWETFPGKDKISKNKFKLIVATFFYLLLKSAIDYGKIYWFPERLGVFGVFKTKTKPKVVDYMHYKKTGQIIYQKNLHSHGFMTKVSWLMRWPKFDVGDSYINNVFRYKCTRDFNRYLARQVKQENTIHKYFDYEH